jgi:hypothetical protein
MNHAFGKDLKECSQSGGKDGWSFPIRVLWSGLDLWCPTWHFVTLHHIQVVPETFREWFADAKLSVNKLNPAVLSMLSRFLALKVC